MRQFGSLRGITKTRGFRREGWWRRVLGAKIIPAAIAFTAVIIRFWICRLGVHSCRPLLLVRRFTLIVKVVVWVGD